jgi:hypothetical protein
LRLIAPNNGTVPFLCFRRLSLPIALGLLASAVAVVPAGGAPVPQAASSSGSSSSRTSITLARPVGTAAGQVMVASIVSNSDDPVSAPAGWTLVRADTIPGVLGQTVYVKVAGAAEPSSYTWRLSDYRRVAGGITTYGGVDTTHPIDVQAAAVMGGAGTALTAPSLTTTVADTLLIHVGAISAEGTLTPPSGMTERWEAASPNFSNSRDVLASASDGPQPVAGPTGARTVTASRPGPSIAVSLALRPAGDAPPQPPGEEPPAPPPGDPVLVGAGDIAYCSGSGDEATAALLDGIQGTVFTTGDNAYLSPATAAEYARCYGPNWGRHKNRTLPSAGNHEYDAANAAGYFGYFGASAGDPTKGYYDTTVGAWHIIVLNSNCAFVSCGAGSPQEQWLRSVLAASNAACTAAIFHHPRFSSGQNSSASVRAFWEALYDYGADVVFNGHDHLYERFAPQTPAGAADPAFGLRQFTIGSGGRSHHTFVGVAPNSEARNAGTYGVLKLTLHATSYDWQFVPEAGKSFTDSGGTACHGAASAQPPPQPDPDPVPQPQPESITPVASSSSGSSSSRSSLTLARPAGTAAGQVMVASIVINDDDPVSAPVGWTLVRADTIPGVLGQAVYVKVAGAAEPPSYTWTLSDFRRMAGGITTYAGVDTAQPVDVHAATVSPDGATALTAPSVTTTVAGTLLVHVAAISAEGNLDPAPGMTERWEAASPNGSNSRDALASVSDAPQPVAGPTGPRTVTATRPGPRIAAHLALRPAA